MPITFLDTETTGLSLDDDIWEFAAIRREDDGTESVYHAFVEHSEKKCHHLPDPFFTDHRNRFPADCSNRVLTQRELTHMISSATREAHIVGAVPNFDTERMALVLRNDGLRLPEWHYHLIDVENLAVGFLAGRNVNAHPKPGLLPLPWDSNAISSAVGVDPERFARHTAMGDALWARAIYDVITSGLIRDDPPIA